MTEGPKMRGQTRIGSNCDGNNKVEWRERKYRVLDGYRETVNPYIWYVRSTHRRFLLLTYHFFAFIIVSIHMFAHLQSTCHPASVPSWVSWDGVKESLWGQVRANDPGHHRTGEGGKQTRTFPNSDTLLALKVFSLFSS